MYLFFQPWHPLQSHINRSKTSGCVCPAVDLSVCVCTCGHLCIWMVSEEPVCLRSILLSRSSHLLSVTDHYSLLEASVKLQTVVACSSIHLSCLLFLWRVKMPFHHVRAGLLYTDNFLSTSLSETSEEQLANISTEELGGEWVCVCFIWMAAICLSVKYL